MLVEVRTVYRIAALLSVLVPQSNVTALTGDVEPLTGASSPGTVGAVVSMITVHVDAQALYKPAVSLERAVQYQCPCFSVTVAWEMSVTELYVIPLKSDDVDARIAYWLIPLSSELLPQSNAIKVPADNAPLTGDSKAGTDGTVPSMVSVLFAAHALPLAATSLDLAVQYHSP